MSRLRDVARLPASDSRGQTVLDFAIGAGVFLLAVGVVFAFVPTMFEPFAGSAGSTPIVADRSADLLSGSLLAADPATPSVLDTACTAAFFGSNGSLSSAGDCGFVADDPLVEILGLGDRSVSVAVRDLSDSPTSGEPHTVAVDGTDYTLTRGTEGVPSDVSVASRVVSIDGDAYRLVVKVW